MLNPPPKFNIPYISNLPVESDLVETKDISSCDIIECGFYGIEVSVVFSSKRFAFVFEKFQDPPN